jgi:hypothetical protein
MKFTLFIVAFITLANAAPVNLDRRAVTRPSALSIPAEQVRQQPPVLTPQGSITGVMDWDHVPKPMLIRPPRPQLELPNVQSTPEALATQNAWLAQQV